jgi:hypothetical protein
LFCRHVLDQHPEVTGFADVKRLHVESFTLAQSSHVTARGTP